jgi:hypothetical protein
MNDWENRIEYLAERQVRGEMDAADLAALSELCRNPEAARAFVEALADRHEWGEWAGRVAPPQNFVRAVVERRDGQRKSTV